MKPRPLLLASISAVAALGLGLAGCSGPAPAATTAAPAPTSAAPATTEAAPPPTTEAPKTFTIGSAVIVSHPALQAVQDGFEEVLKEQGIKYTMITKNAQGDPANAATIASDFASNKDIALILAISTPIAQAMASAEKTRPIIFSAVTDPVDAGLVPSWEKAGANMTGTSDLNPEGKPVSLVKEAIPGAKTVGVIYSSSEANSLVQVKAYQEEAKGLGITIKTKTVTSQAEVSAAVAAIGNVDAILIPTDNTVVASLSSVIAYGQEHKIPVFSADTTSVPMGTVATRGPSYHDLGRGAGEMAVKILRDGTPISSIPPVATKATELLVNTGAAAKFGLKLPDALVKQAAQDVQTKTS